MNTINYSHIVMTNTEQSSKVKYSLVEFSQVLSSEVK